jgi:hypothetical protein
MKMTSREIEILRLTDSPNDAFVVGHQAILEWLPNARTIEVVNFYKLFCWFALSAPPLCIIAYYVGRRMQRGTRWE